jgi:glyoxylase-like metal-dependent hydrolase (beta-lactamase superfamily II)
MARTRLAGMTCVRRIIPLTVGWERLPKSYSVHGDTSGLTLVEPVPAIVLDTDDGWTLIDTGMNPALIRDPLYFERFHGRNHAIVPILPEGDGEPLEDALAEHGTRSATSRGSTSRTCTTTTPAGCACSIRACR